eukprot:272795_1
MSSYLFKIGKSKWLMLFFYFIMIIGNGITSKTVHYSTSELQNYMQFNATELQGITVSATHILSIPLSLFTTYIITTFGSTQTTVILQIISLFGWIIFADGVSIKSLTQMTFGRIIQGGAFGAKRVAIIVYCTHRFKQNNLSFALGCLTMAAKLAMIIGP